MFKSYNFLRRDYITSDVKTLDRTLLECICEHFYIVHNYEVVRDIQIFQSVSFLLYDLTQFFGRQARQLSI